MNYNTSKTDEAFAVALLARELWRNVDRDRLTSIADKLMDMYKTTPAYCRDSHEGYRIAASELYDCIYAKSEEAA